MSATAAAFLVVRCDEGFGEVFPLQAGARFTLGRATTNRVVLKDELCSREHAEVYRGDGHWYLRDLGSLNGTRLNNLPITEEHALEPRDEVGVGRTRLVFVEDMQQLPDLPRQSRKPDDGVAIRKRLNETRYLKPAESAADGQATVLHQLRVGHALEQDLSLLYKLALRMGGATTTEQLVQVVLDGLLE